MLADVRKIDVSRQKRGKMALARRGLYGQFTRSFTTATKNACRRPTRKSSGRNTARAGTRTSGRDSTGSSRSPIAPPTRPSPCSPNSCPSTALTSPPRRSRPAPRRGSLRRSARDLWRAREGGGRPASRPGPRRVLRDNGPGRAVCERLLSAPSGGRGRPWILMFGSGRGAGTWSAPLGWTWLMR